MKKRSFIFLSVLLFVAILLTFITLIQQKQILDVQQAISDKLGIDGSQLDHSERNPIGFDTTKKS